MVNEALDKLEAEDAALADVVKLRYFAGLTIPETASVLGVSERTVNCQWSCARAWLYREISEASSRNTGAPSDAHDEIRGTEGTAKAPRSPRLGNRKGGRDRTSSRRTRKDMILYALRESRDPSQFRRLREQLGILSFLPRTT